MPPFWGVRTFRCSYACKVVLKQRNHSYTAEQKDKNWCPIKKQRLSKLVADFIKATDLVLSCSFFFFPSFVNRVFSIGNVMLAY